MSHFIIGIIALYVAVATPCKLCRQCRNWLSYSSVKDEMIMLSALLSLYSVLSFLVYLVDETRDLRTFTIHIIYVPFCSMYIFMFVCRVYICTEIFRPPIYFPTTNEMKLDNTLIIHFINLIVCSSFKLSLQLRLPHIYKKQ